MKEYISVKELIELIQKVINIDIDLGENNKGKYHHFSMDTKVYNKEVEINMVDCVALDEVEYYYLLSSSYEMDNNDRLMLIFRKKFNLKKYYEGMREDNCVKQYLSNQFNVKRLVK